MDEPEDANCYLWGGNTEYRLSFSEFEKYRIVQDRLFMSDYDRYLIALENEAKRLEDGEKEDVT